MAFIRVLSASIFVSGVLAMATACVPTTASQTHPNAAKPQSNLRFGLHGMLLFSDGVHLFASHLPMFHAPHDVQVVLRIEFADKHQQHALISELTKAPTVYWTLEPELFDLNRFSELHPLPLHEFKAKLYQGHFERGGRLTGIANVRVQRVEWFYPLHAHGSSISQFQLLVQQTQLCIYLYRINQQPSFDQLLLVKALQANAVLQCPAFIDAPANPEAALAAVRTKLNADITSVYLETADLQ